jgi:hypothetical protein
MREFAISSLRSGRYHPAIRWKTCCAKPRISGKERRLPTRFCTRKTAHILFRNSLILSRGEE